MKTETTVDFVMSAKVGTIAVYMLIALVMAFVMAGAFSLTVYAAEDEQGGIHTPVSTPIQVVEQSQNQSQAQSMIVNATWLDDDLLRIDVLDTATGVVSSLAIRLSDFITDADNSPYIMIQAVDLEGNVSGIVRIANPFYVPGGGAANDGGNSGFGGGIIRALAATMPETSETAAMRP